MIEISCLWSVEAAFLRALAKRDTEHWRRHTGHQAELAVEPEKPRKYERGPERRIGAHHKKTEESYKRLLRANP